MAIQGFHLKLSDRPDVVARLARGDVNMPDFDGFPIHVQVLEVKFEVAVYELLRAEPAIMSSRLLYHRIPAQHPDPRLNLPRDISGRRLLVFERAEGENNVWDELDTEGKVSISRFLQRTYIVLTKLVDYSCLQNIQLNGSSLCSSVDICYFRTIFLPRQPASARPFLASNFHLPSSPLGCGSASLSRSPILFRFPWHRHAGSVLPLSCPRSKQRSVTLGT